MIDTSITFFGPDRRAVGVDLASIDDYERETEYAPPADPFIVIEPDDTIEDAKAGIARVVYAPREERFYISGEKKWETR